VIGPVSGGRVRGSRWTAAGRRRLSALFLALAALASACGEGAAQRPNVLLVTIDTQRADALGIYGNPGGHTPHIDRLAADAVVFEQAVTSSGTTFPSHATMFTGLEPASHGVRSNADRLDASFTTLAERLFVQGYDTAAFVSYASMLVRGGLDQGFLAVSDREAPERGMPVRRGSDVNALAQAWLATPRERPFLLWVHYFEPHAPLRLTEYARSRLGHGGGPFGRRVSVQELMALGRDVPWTPERREALRIFYDGETREADRLVGELLDLLRSEGLYDRTIVVLTADHGEALGEHGDVGHGLVVWEPVLRVPLVIRDPRNPGPRRVATRVGLVDLAPTLLDLLDMEAPEPSEGRSVAAAVRGEPIAEARYFAQTRPLEGAPGRRDGSEENTIVYQGPQKAVITATRVVVYDLGEDPGEEQGRTLAAGEPEAQRWRQAAAGLLQAAEPAAPAPRLSREVEAELRALGYLE
jgi:arylsulfatase A-like enzyme